MHNINFWGNQYRCNDCGCVWDMNDTPPESCGDARTNAGSPAAPFLPARQQENFKPVDSSLMEDQLQRMSPKYFEARRGLILQGYTKEQAMKILDEHGIDHRPG